MTALTHPVQTEAPEQSPHVAIVALGLAAGLGSALLAHWFVPQIGILTWAVALGVVAANLGAVPARATRVLGWLTRRFQRIGVVLLGFSVSFTAIAALGLPLVAMVVMTLVSTLFFTLWLGRRLGLSPARALLIATGTSICGASAIAAMEDTAEGSEEDVTVSIAMITLFGTVAIVLLPLLQQPLGLTGEQLGIWAGASVHEVGQVVAAASPAGTAVVAVAIVVKLTRVVMLAPVVGAVSALRRYRSRGSAAAVAPPLVPLFVLGFLGCVGLRTTGMVPAVVLEWIQPVQVAALGAAMFGLGTGVRFSALLRGTGRVTVVAAAGTLFIGLVSLAGLVLVTD